jgi:REP element-mobilizing transposase RayT
LGERGALAVRSVVSAPLAYFLTWVTKGSWLHGDPRGSVNRLQNQVGEPLVRPSVRAVARERRMVGHDGITLSEAMRCIVHDAIVRHCEHRGWSALAVHVRTQHVHVVVSRCGGVAPERVMAEFKAWSTRRLRESSLVQGDAKLWTTHGSTRWINDSDSLERAVHYVLHEQ